MKPSSRRGCYKLNVRLLVCALISVPLAELLPLTSAHADGGLRGIVSDPLKLGEASQNIKASVDEINVLLSHLDKTEAKSNHDLADRINQVQNIVNNIMSSADKDIDKANADIAALEQQIFQDASSLMDQATCVIEVAANDQAQRAVMLALAQITKAHPGITLAGIPIISTHFEEIKIDDPDKAYISTREYYLKSLESLQPEDPAYRVVSVYANIMRFARFASCSYKLPEQKVTFNELLRERIKYENLLAPWGTILVAMEQ